MSTVLVTIVAPRRRLDVSLPGEVAIGDLVPDLIDLCVDKPDTAADATWGVGVLGAPPFDPMRSLDETGVTDGSLLYLMKLTPHAKPPPAPAPPPRTPRDSAQRHPIPLEPAIADSGYKGRWGVEPSVSMLALPTAVVVIMLAWLLTGFSAGAGIAEGLLAAAGLLVAYVGVLLFLGFGPWLSRRGHK